MDLNFIFLTHVLMFDLFMYVYSCNALSARFFAVDRALNSNLILWLSTQKQSFIKIGQKMWTYIHTYMDRPTLLCSTSNFNVPEYELFYMTPDKQLTKNMKNTSVNVSGLWSSSTIM